MVQPEAFLVFVHDALNGMLRILEELGDDRINQRPDLPEANSPYIIMAHCVGLTHYWIGRVCAGRPYARDRDGEFSAHGSLADMQQAVRDLQGHLADDIKRVQVDQPAAGELDGRHRDLHHLKQGDFLMRCYKELAQHHGHMDITRDILRQG
ncbi:mycothiol transferase [Candidatus Entotheonella palauensis]|uniref:DinB-like domain-containing protein n=1 Tax=Candidatus Entotheonella gemina TaxID=1429439 RepID=W4LNN6_9BACT|nr:DUF664 domain-containing protein [Candidatus Entotheonella palauensis]ETW99587.1 MAG: hypothetical protein ETSY2_40645 [Candidatus Entotheonella gemina]